MRRYPDDRSLVLGVLTGPLKLGAKAVDLLTNAVEAIQVGVADYQTGTRPRLLSAVRNIHAGVLLMYKEALRRHSPPGSKEVLVKAKIRPVPTHGAGLGFVGVGRRTVNVHQIQERFTALGISADWKAVKQLTDTRNDIEHYFPSLSAKALEGLIATALLLIRNFSLNELKQEPRDLLGENTWNVMLEVAEVFNAERDECQQAIRDFVWGSSALESGVAEISCSACGARLLKPRVGSFGDIILECRSCGRDHHRHEYAATAVAEALSLEAYLAVSDGAVEPYGICPECGVEAYLSDENICANCDESVDRECLRCGAGIPVSELDFSPLCSYCDHVMMKDD